MTRCCGRCVHRNAQPMAWRGSCAPVGMRLASDPPCASWFGLEQLIAATALQARA